jgi:hypothetical protein
MTKHKHSLPTASPLNLAAASSIPVAVVDLLFKAMSWGSRIHLPTIFRKYEPAPFAQGAGGVSV